MILRQPTLAPKAPLPDRSSIEVEVEYGFETSPVLDPAAIERFRQWRFKPGKVRQRVIPIPPLVPPPPNHESSRWIKAIS